MTRTLPNGTIVRGPPPDPRRLAELAARAEAEGPMGRRGTKVVRLRDGKVFARIKDALPNDPAGIIREYMRFMYALRAGRPYRGERYAYASPPRTRKAGNSVALDQILSEMWGGVG